MAEVSKYLLAARQAMQEENYADAQKYFEMVKLDDPTNIEAKIQYQYCKFLDCVRKDSYNCYTDYMNLLKHAVINVAESEMPLEEQLAFLSHLIDDSVDALKLCCSALSAIRVEGDDTFATIRGLKRRSILFARDFGDAMEKKYADSPEGMQIACHAWKSFVDRINGNTSFSKKGSEVASIPTYVAKIQAIDPTYTFVEKKRGCL